MLFTSVFFPVFFVLVFALYARSNLRWQNIILVVASYVFYGWWDWRFTSLLAISTLGDFILARAIAAEEQPGKKRLYLLASLLLNLGILGFFKYFNFFVDSFTRMVMLTGWEPDFVTLNILLPVGISFYTFQTLSYTIDVYRGELKPTKNLLNFAVYVSFFPQLVAGPIERATHFLPQVEKPRAVTASRFRRGMWLVILGYFKKVVVADNCAILANEVFNNPGPPDLLLTVMGVYAFAFQIYGDFSGYSDIARGLAKMMGFDLMINFKRPYFAQTPQTFWKRWHISLSTWLRDYLYIPLGGNRDGTVATYRNLCITMFLGGLWHGAKMTFVLWGIYQGAILVVHRLWANFTGGRHPNRRKSVLERVVMGFFFFNVVCAGWFFFRLNSLDDVARFWEGAFIIDLNSLSYLLVLLVFTGPLLLLDACWELTGNNDDIPEWNRWVLAGVAYVLLALIICMGNWSGGQFIYFQF